MDYKAQYKVWLNEPGLAPGLREELVAIAQDEREIEERFYTELEFGTAGLRGVLGAGTNRMNVHVVRRATSGLADYLLSFPGAAERGVAIAYDSREMSADFAMEAALTIAARGIRVYLYSTLHSVPQLSFAILQLHCIAGIVITASHNPPEYNGYKVYWEHGGQAGPVQAGEILSRIREAGYFGTQLISKEEALEAGLLTMIGTDIDEAYYASAVTLLPHAGLLRREGSGLKLVYTPLHGTGNVPVTELLHRVGVNNVAVVAQQREPDPRFPTVSAPNPEDPAAFTLAIELANKTGADMILATDPDADRLGLAVRGSDGRFAVLTGNQIGALLIHHILSSMSETGTLPQNGLVVKSIVSSRMADAVCARYGVAIEDVLTGFRFISEKIDECEMSKSREFIFGFEESFGFLRGSFSRDKDAISSAVLLADAAVYCRGRGMTLYDLLMEMYRIYGYFMEKVASYTLGGKEGLERIAAAMDALREAPPALFGGSPVVVYEDFLSSQSKTVGDDAARPIPLPPSNVLRYTLSNGTWLCVRPSGTEPKLKLYIGVRGDTDEAASAALSGAFADADALMRRLLQL